MKNLPKFFARAAMLVVIGSGAPAFARDIPEVFPLAGGGAEVRFENGCNVLYGSDRRMSSVTPYCAASQVNTAIAAANRHFGGGFGSGSGADVSSVTCESLDGRRSFCRTMTAGGVRLVRQLSSAACTYSRDWGYDQQGIWVDNGCRAVFEVRAGSAMQPATAVTCESRSGRRESCRADTSGGVRLERRLSSAACDVGRDWGFDHTEIWVDGGCRAVFQLRPGFAQAAATLTCESQNGRKNICRAVTAGGVRLARKLSSAACEAGRDWGYDHTGIWVDNGCRAVFEIGGAW